MECLETNFVSSVGPFVERFEQQFAAYVGAGYAIACASGTAALHVAMRLIDLQPQQEVFVSDLTFIASANPILYERGRPVLVDADPATWNLDAQLIIGELQRRARIGQQQPAAVIAVHIIGLPADLQALAGVCAEYGIVLIEDAAESLGARYIVGSHAGRHTGTIGQIGCYSFNGNKLITTGGGGMIVTNDPALARRAKHLTTQARLPGAAYHHDEVGYNYRLTNLAAALGVAQLEAIDDILTRKARIAARYDAALTGTGLEPMPRCDWAQPSHWLHTVLAPSRSARDDLMAHLDRQQIMARPLWTPLHRMPMFAGLARLGAGSADDLADRGLSLPCSAGLTIDQQQQVIDAIRSWYGT
jgi:dTDP-4-amino-4,6-dideoxygalactose transaminase